MTPHPPLTVAAGDDWEIDATLLDEEGFPYDLTASASTIKWRLLDKFSRPVIGDEAVITITDELAGKIQIHVPAAVTSEVRSGRFTDAIRLQMGGATGTLSMGWVTVVADPWANPEAA
jgi:hypothetical protein